MLISYFALILSCESSWIYRERTNCWGLNSIFNSAELSEISDFSVLHQSGMVKTFLRTCTQVQCSESAVRLAAAWGMSWLRGVSEFVFSELTASCDDL